MKPLLDHREIAAWAEQQEPYEEYQFSDVGNCALCRFLHFRGIKIFGVGGCYWVDEREKKHYFDSKLATALARGPHTFGALADRLRTAE